MLTDWKGKLVNTIYKTNVNFQLVICIIFNQRTQKLFPFTYIYAASSYSFSYNDLGFSLP